MINRLFIYNSVVGLLNKAAVKNEAHLFSSGAIMLDIWNNDKLYVLQFEEDFIGFSEVIDENPGFDTIPDEKFFDEKIVERIKLLVPTINN